MQPGKRRTTALAAWVTIGVALAACGSGTKTVTVKQASAPSGTNTTSSGPNTSAATTTPSVPACESLISQGANGVGSCEVSGKEAKYAGPGHQLYLSGSVTQVIKIHRGETSISSGVAGGSTAKAHGVFVIVTLQVKNLEKTPQHWKDENTSLILGGNTYTPNFEAENGPDENSFVWKSEPIQPQEAVEHDVVFDVPSSVANSPEGAVAIRDFGEEKSEESYDGLLLLRRSTGTAPPSASATRKYLDTAKVAANIEKAILSQRGLHASVSCPKEVAQEVGRTFTCTATTEGVGTAFKATVRTSSGYVTYVAE